MADEKRQLILDLLARNKMGSETSAAARDIDKLGTAAEQADRKTERLGKTTEATGHETDKLGRNVRETKGHIAGLDREIENVNRELAGLAESFAKAGDAGERLDISKAIRRSENDLRRLNKSKGLLEAILPDPQPAAKSWVKRLNDSVVGDLASSSFLGTAGTVVGAILAPEIGGLISAAVLGSVGGAGILGGIVAAASHSQEIKSYAGNIGKTFVSGVQEQASAAFDKPIMSSLNKVEALSRRSVGKIGQIFQSTAPSLDHLTDSAVKASDVILDSLVGAAAKAGPTMDALGNFIEHTADSLGGFIDMAANHSDAAVSALNDLDNALQNTLEAATKFADGLAYLKEGQDSVDNAIDKGRYYLEDHARFLDLTADGYKKGSVAAELYRQGVIGVAGSANDYDHYLAGAVTHTDQLAGSQDNAAKAARGHRDALVGLSNELRAQVDPVFGLLNAEDQMRNAQTKLNKAIKEHGRDSTEARAATRELAEAALDLQGKAGGLGATFDGKLTPAMRNTLHAAGLTDAEIAAVAREFRRAKGAGDAYAKTYRARIITDYINRQTNIVTNAAQDAYEQTKRQIGKRASGGPVSRGTPYLVGENGPEIVVPTAAGRVLSAAGTRGMAKAGMAGQPVGAGRSGPRTIALQVEGEQRVASFLKYMIRSYNVLEA